MNFDHPYGLVYYLNRCMQLTGHHLVRQMILAEAYIHSSTIYALISAGNIILLDWQYACLFYYYISYFRRNDKRYMQHRLSTNIVYNAKSYPCEACAFDFSSIFDV